MFATFIAAALIAAPPTQPSNCKDDKGEERCSAVAQSRLREALGMQPIADVAKTGAIARRVAYIDGYGNNLLGIEFVRPAASDPMVRVILPARQGRERRDMEAPISAERWSAILAASANTDREYVEKPDPGTVNICLHSWVMLFEAADQNHGASGVRGRLKSGCGASPVSEFAMAAAKEAVAVFAPCERLDPTNYRNDATRLAACFTLQGDRLAAADFTNRTDGLSALTGSARKALGLPNSYKLSANWNGQSATGVAAKTLLMAQLPENDRVDMTIAEVRGLTPTTGTAKGMLHRRSAGEVTTVDEANITLNWDLQWRQPVTAVTVGPWKTRKLP